MLMLLYSTYSQANQGRRVFRADLVPLVGLDLKEDLVTLGNQD